MKSMLVLENGSCFEGVSIGASGERIGEIALNTAVVGYQEMMTDPANAGKILVLTYPLIGNYGIADTFFSGSRSWLAALVIKEKSRIFSNWQAERSLDAFLKSERLLGIEGIDTRTLAVTIREYGEMLGIISTRSRNRKQLLAKLKRYKKTMKKSFIQDISVKKVTKISARGTGPHIGVLDLGVTSDLIGQLKELSCPVTLIPYDTEAATIRDLSVDGLVISNGPENDESIGRAVSTVRSLLGTMPVAGISTGHQVIGLALGGRLTKMKKGHRGVNCPIKPPDTYKGEITVQNHASVVDEGSIKNIPHVEVTARNVNDGSIEEMASTRMKCISAQYLPARPGYNEVHSFLKRFVAMADSAGKGSCGKPRQALSLAR